LHDNVKDGNVAPSKKPFVAVRDASARQMVKTRVLQMQATQEFVPADF